MKILLQDYKTEKYMRIDSLWTEDIKLGMDFLSIVRAVSFGIKELKNSFNIVQIEESELPDVAVVLPSKSKSITTISMDDLLIPATASVTRYAVSADIIEPDYSSANQN